MSEVISTRAPAVRDYARDASPSATTASSVRWESLRTDVQLLSADVTESHHQMRSRELHERAVVKARMTLDDLLSELFDGRGMSWSHIAELSNVSVSAVRKWRYGGAASPAKKLEVARLAAVLDLLEERGAVGDPAAWLELDLPFEDSGYHVRPMDLYARGLENAILDIACRRRGVSEVLDDVMPEWRDGRSQFEVFGDEDGQRSIRLRDGRY